MKTRLLMLMILLAWVMGAAGQAHEQGVVVDSLNGRPLERAVVGWRVPGKRDSLKVLTDTLGQFTASGMIVVSYIGYRTKTVLFKGGTVSLSPAPHEMQEVVIEAPAIQLKPDTVEYRADAFPVRKDGVLEDLLKKMPGIQVDINGNILAYGRPIVKIRINGKDFFLNDPKLASQNLPADIIEKIQVIEDKSDQAKLTGFDDGERQMVLNITIKKSRTDSYLGNVTAGAGTDGRYLGTARLFRFDKSEQLTALGEADNTNGTNVTSGGTNSGPPENDARNAGVNFSGNIAPRLVVNGSYNYNGNHTVTNTTSIRQNYQDTFYVYSQNAQTSSNQFDHNVQLTVGYGAGKNDTLIFNPHMDYNSHQQVTSNAFSFQNAAGAITSSGIQSYSANSQSPNLAGSINWLHRFSEAGRTLSVYAYAGPGPVKETDNNFSTNHIYTPSSLDTIWQVSNIHTQNKQYNASVSYTEPLGKDKVLQVIYRFSRSENISGKSVYDVSAVNKTFNDSLSNTIDNILTTHNLGLNFRQGNKTYSYQIGFGLQPTYMDSKSVQLDTPRDYYRPVLQVVPLANFSYQFSPQRRIHFLYTGYTQQPAISQLQPVPDYSNPLYISLGNPKLQPSFNHTFRVDYNDIDRETGRSFFLRGWVYLKENAIVNNTTQLPGGREIIQPVNVGGNYSASSYYDYSVPFLQKMFLLSLSGSLSYNNNVSLDSGARNIGRTWGGRQGLRLAYNRGKWLDLSANVNYTLNNSTFSLEPGMSDRVSSWEGIQEGRADLPGDFSLRYTFNYTLHEGVPSSVGKQVTLLSLVVEKRILNEKGILALSVNDLFNNNIGYSHQVGDGFTEDDFNTVMSRFFLLSFTWKFQKRR